jgi:hypothetical protein
MARHVSVGFDTSHDDFEMSSLKSWNGADVGAINEDGRRAWSDAAQAMWTRQVFRLDLICDPREAISNAFVIVRAGGGHEKIKNPVRFAK